MKEILEKLRQAIIEGESEKAKELTEKAINSGIDPMIIIEDGIKKAMDEVGEKFEKLEFFITNMMFSAEAAKAATDILKPTMAKDKLSEVYAGKVVIGTVEGDIHDIGKNIVSIMLQANGFEVIDLGTDVEARVFVEEAEREKVNIIGMSCLLTPSMFYMGDVIQRLEDKGTRNKFYVIIGGAAIYPDWAKEIKADGWAKDAEKAVKLCNLLIKSGKEVKKPIIME